MARLLTSGFECKDPKTDGGGTSSSYPAGITHDTTHQRSGAVCLAFDSTAGTPQINTTAITLTTGVSLYTRGHYFFTALPSSASATIMQYSGTALVSVRLTSGGKLQLWNDTGTPAQIGSDSVSTITTGLYYRIELRVQWASGSVDIAELQLNGFSVASASNLALSDTNTTTSSSFGWITSPGAANTLYLDDISINDSSGSAQNSWCGEGNIVNLFPTSDNARATLWTGGAGGTTNLFDAVNNTPPTGTATETDATQIEHAGGAAGSTDAYDANMTTYLAAGIQVNDPIILIQPVIVHGEDSATGTKLLTFSVVSNPAISAIANFAAGADVGALGTHPISWTRTLGTTSYVPSITLGTAPVMRVTRPETASRVASVDAMTMIVEYVSSSGLSFGTPFGQYGKQQMQQLIGR